MMPSTTEALLDVNVLIAAIFEDHPEHARAHEFVQSLEHFYTCPTTQGGFLRFATRPWKDQGVAQEPRLSMADAQTTLRAFTDTEGHVFLPDRIAFTGLPLRSLSGHKQWTDAYLLSLARLNRLHLASLESRMSNLDDEANPALFLVT
jgi:toxin-antitoxin system PIN domain toxin